MGPTLNRSKGSFRSCGKRNCEGLEGWFVFQAMRFSYCLTGQLPVTRVNSTGQCWLLFAGVLQTKVGEQLDIARGGVALCLRGSTRIRARHIGNAIMCYILLHIDWILMSGGPGRFGATALVDGNIDEYAPRLHLPKHFACD
jgi:hypothetical protein